MTTQALQVQQPSHVTQWKSPSAVRDRIDAIQNLMKQVLKPATKDSGWDGDYGVIPGTGNKPSLLKAGSEQILAMFEIAVDPIVEDLSTEDCARFRVTCRLIHAPSGDFLGAGIGEASTNETKYKWKRTYSKQEFDNTDPERRKLKFYQVKGRNDMWEDKSDMLIRTEPADLANTVLKMAKKRAQIDATLTVTGASSMFAQDLEESDDQEQKESQPSTRGKKSGKSSPKATDDVKCAQCQAVNGHLPSCKYHPKNQSGTGQPATQPVQGEVMPKETKKEAEVPKTTSKESVVVKAFSLKDKKKASGKYGELIVTQEDGAEGWRYIWHKHLMEPPCDLSTAVGKLCVLEISMSGTAEKPYYSVEHVHQIGTQVFVDDKPVDAPSAAEVGFAPTDEDGPNW